MSQHAYEMWRSEDSFHELVFFVHLVDAGVKFRQSRLVAGTFTCWAVSPVLASLEPEAVLQDQPPECWIIVLSWNTQAKLEFMISCLILFTVSLLVYLQEPATAFLVCLLLLLFVCLERWPYCVALVGLELAMQTRLALNSRRSIFFCLQSTGIKHLCHHGWPTVVLKAFLPFY